ncbi:MAG: hypothetical protein NDI77_09410 [Geobacteraceae bacterium]|nr:hypothetical protein [Geobacteraceae bacterium]
MEKTGYNRVCDRTERKEERVRLRNLKTGEIGLSFGCTMEGATIQVELENGELDSWSPEDCEEA